MFGWIFFIEDEVLVYFFFLAAVRLVFFVYLPPVGNSHRSYSSTGICLGISTLRRVLSILVASFLLIVLVYPSPFWYINWVLGPISSS